LQSCKPDPAAFSVSGVNLEKSSLEDTLKFKSRSILVFSDNCAYGATVPHQARYSSNQQGKYSSNNIIVHDPASFQEWSFYKCGGVFWFGFIFVMFYVWYFIELFLNRGRPGNGR
jgi:hypothetical protein